MYSRKSCEISFDTLVSLRAASSRAHRAISRSKVIVTFRRGVTKSV